SSDLSGRESPLEIRDQIVGALDSDRQSQQVRGNRGARSLHAHPVLDETLDAAKRGRPLPQPSVRRDSDGRLFAARNTDRQHPAETDLHLSCCEVIALTPAQSGFQHLDDVRTVLEMLYDEQ